MSPEPGESWDVLCEDVRAEPTIRVTVLVLSKEPRQQLTCLTLASAVETVWPPAEVTTWPETSFEPPSRRIA